MADAIKRLAGAALVAVQAAQQANTPDNRGAAERASVRLAKQCDGVLPDGGGSLDRRCRAELRDGKPGQATERYAAYLRNLAGTVSTTQASDDAARPESADPKGKKPGA